MKKLSVVIVLLLAACSRHDDLPPVAAVIEPPTPTNFTVLDPGDHINYLLEWQVSAPDDAW